MQSNIIMLRRHRDYQANEEAWRRALAAYSGGREYISIALVKHLTELAEEFAERRERACYFNYPRKIARLLTQYALSVDPQRINADPGMVEDFSRTGLRVNEVMRQCSTYLNVTGSVWLLVAMPGYSGVADMERARRERLRPYVRVLSPLDVVDWAFGSDGMLLWAIVENDEYEDTNPTEPVRKIRTRLLWTRDRWEYYRAGVNGAVSTGVNPIGAVPLIHITEPDGFGIGAHHWFEDAVRISDAIMNNESEAQMNIIKQMFGLLVVSESFYRSSTRPAAASGSAAEPPQSIAATIGRSVAIVETPDEKGVCRYIAPGGVENSSIAASNAELKRELYDTVGLAIQSGSREAQTAESKSWDFVNISQFLSTRADMLEQAELQAWTLINRWDASIPVPEVTYNRRFAVVDLQAAVAAVVQASTLPALGVEFQKQIARTTLELMEQVTPVPDDKKIKILEEIDEMTAAPEFDPAFGVDNEAQATGKEML